MKNEKVLNTIEEAIEDFRQGKIVIVVDDEDRENEGDFIIAAEKVTPKSSISCSRTVAACCAPRFPKSVARSSNST